jgi:hypothetical protein
MWETFSNSPQHWGGVLVVAAIASCILGLAAIQAWRQNQAAKMDSDLKMEMVARGMSADEIERVLKARSIGATKTSE